MIKYPKYKASGVILLGNIPEHWKVKKLKWIAKICNGQDQKKIIDEDGKYPIIGSGGVFGRTNSYLHKGHSVILGRKGTIDKPQYIETPFWSVDTAYYTEMLPNTHSKFFYYCCLTIQFDLYKYGAAVPSMTQETLNQIPFAYPPFVEQVEIANYLTDKTKKIDDLIEKKQKLIDLLKEERTLLINQAVTLGLEDNPKTKDSGSVWLGQINANWSIKRLKYLCKITTGSKNTEDRVNDGAYPFYVRSQTIERINTYSYDCVGILTAGDGVGVGKVFHLVSGKFELHQRVYLFYDFTSEILPEYLFFYLQQNLINELMMYNAKSTVDSVRLPVLQDFRVVYPNLQEQIKIISKLKQDITKIDEVCLRSEKEIELLKEYRLSLITEVVTGKIKVV